MSDLRPVFLVIGLLVALLGVAMMLPAAADLAAGNPDWRVFATAALVSTFLGSAAVLSCRTGSFSLTVRQTFLMTVLAWVIVAGFAALPFVFANLALTATDGYFEAMSAITTTGSTVITGLDRAPPGILLWRGLLQWLGGLGTLVMAVTVLPNLKIGGMEMFRLEGRESERLMPRAARVASGMMLLYAALTAAHAVLLWLAGMTAFDSTIHAMTTLSTGGFSTADASLARFASPPIEWLIILGMIAGGLPYLQLLRLFQRHHRSLLRDDQIRWYFGTMAAATALVGVWLWQNLGMSPATALRTGAFAVTSVMTGTGFATTDFNAWVGPPLALLFFLGFTGGCAGSTASGLKMFRAHILFANARAQTARLLRPNTVRIPYFNGRRIPEEVSEAVMGYLFVYALGFALLAMGLSLTGLNFMAALAAAISAIGNVGPALGPTQGITQFTDPAKWLLVAGMLFGRIEMFLLLVLFVPAFWRS